VVHATPDFDTEPKDVVYLVLGMSIFCLWLKSEREILTPLRRI